MTTDGGEQVGARFVVAATGCLSSTNTPEFAGIADYAGLLLHTGNWPHEPVDFTGRRVAVIGTGSSGIQSIPVIAEQADHLTVFQRTPNYSRPGAQPPARSGRRGSGQGRVRDVPRGQPDDDLGLRFAPATQRRGDVVGRRADACRLSWRPAGDTVDCRSSAPSTTSSSIATPTPSWPTSSAARSADVVTDPETADLLSPVDRDRLQAALRRHRLLRHVQP